MKKIILASAAAFIVTLSFASASEAGWRHHGPRFFDSGFNIVLDAGPRYVESDYGDDEGNCYIKKIRKINRYGELVIKRVQVCD